MPKVGFPIAGALCVLAGTLGPGLVRDARADATLAVRLPRPPAAARSISIRAVAVETRQVLAGSSLAGAAGRATLTVRAVPQVVFAEWLLADGKTVSGRSPLLRPVDGRTMTVDLAPMHAAAARPVMIFASYRPASVSGAASGGVSLIGVPGSGFTVRGLDLPGSSIARTVTTEMVKAARCYGEDGGFVIVETDPAALTILKGEIGLSRSPGADPSTRLTDRYVAPSRFVNGSWSSDGKSVTVTLTVVDSQGRQLLNKSATGPLDRVLGINSEVVAALAGAMSCEAREAYRANGPFGEGHVSGTICSGLARAFTLKFDTPVGLVGTFTFTPSSQAGGAWSYSGHFQNVVTNTGNGSYTIAGQPNGRSRVTIEIPAGAKWVQTTVGVGSVSQVGRKESIVLEPLPNGCSKQPD